MREAEFGSAPTILPDQLLDELAENGTDVLRHVIRRVRAEAGAGGRIVARFNNQNGGVPTAPYLGRDAPAGPGADEAGP
ncbi:hypothetical protein OOK41_27040 [Micromonospora sp. NBC_01655]|uniref:hypothetical protein n=1 Tax=unclassified Micromonospora TaxID=2617518 RepID=UPI000FFF1590|nr:MULTISPECIES: hypothetical protein [unclassified Micromonospora]MCX4473920.1 hypothetical protein [Micromonospora sp. NBC_01655]